MEVKLTEIDRQLEDAESGEVTWTSSGKTTQHDSNTIKQIEKNET